MSKELVEVIVENGIVYRLSLIQISYTTIPALPSRMT